MTSPRRPALVLAALSALVLALGAGPALGAKSCGRQVIDDWYDNGRVDKLYDLHCYEDAIDALPEDVVAYSSAKEDIERALQNALNQGQPAGDSDEPDPTTPTDTTSDEDEGSDTPPPPPDDDDTPTTTADPRDKDETPEALPDGTTPSSNADSVPLPLIVLGALALLLLAAGGAGYLNRRMQARRIDGGGPPAAL